MSYPTGKSFIDLRSKIRPSKATQILVELDKLTSGKDEKNRRQSLPARSNLINTSGRYSPFAVPSNKFPLSAGRQPRWSRNHNDSDSSFSSISAIKPIGNSTLRHESPVPTFYEMDKDFNEGSFTETKSISPVSTKESEDSFLFEKPLVPGFICDNDIDTFKFDPPEIRGPKKISQSPDELPSEKMAETDSESVLSDFVECGNDEQ